MNSDFFNRLINYVIKFNVKKILIIEIDDVSIIEIEQLAKYTEKVCVATEHFFLRRQLTTRFMNNSHVEIFPTHSIKTYDYDAIVCSEIVSIILPIINSISSIKYIFTKSLDINSIKNFIKLDDIALIKLNEDNKLNDFTNKNDEDTEVGEVDEINEAGKVNEVNETIIDNTLQKIVENTDMQKQIGVENNDNIKLKCSFFIVNYNTSKLINLLINSIHKYVKAFDYDIWIFDNSDKEKLALEETCEDVHILDNTKEQLIDYKKAIKKYCNEKDTQDVFKGTNNINGFVSLRHILALQYGFSLPDISDNMIICDSDIVLKKDIDFIDVNYALIGTIRLDGYNQRMLPYLCYVNKKILKKADVQYFNPLKMRGCKDMFNKTIVKYDTGGSVLEDCALKNLPIKQIIIENYCVHFGGSSREDFQTRFSLNTAFDIDMIEESLTKCNEFINAYDYSKMFNKQTELYKQALSKYKVKSTGKKYVVYTCITGNYDSLMEQPFYEHEKFDYVCFTNSPNIKKSNNWKIIDISGIDKIINENDQQKISRFLKTHPHLFFENYEKSLYIDGNIKILSKDLENDFIKFLGKNEYLLTSQHPFITNVYDEIKVCISKKKDNEENLNRIRELLKTEKFNDLNAHTQMGIILRDHNNKECQKIMEDWWWMIKNFCKRDQTSFNYVFWKNRGKFLSLPFDYIKQYFAIVCHSL